MSCDGRLVSEIQKQIPEAFTEISFDRRGKTQDQPNREKMKFYRLPMSHIIYFLTCKCHPRRPLPFTSSVLTAGMLTCTARGSCSCRDGELIWLCAGPLIFAAANTPGSTAVFMHYVCTPHNVRTCTPKRSISPHPQYIVCRQIVY